MIGTILGVTLGAIAALRKDGWFDHITSVAALAVTSLPEFIVAIALIILFSTVVFHVLPAVSLLPPGTYAWSEPELLILPVATLVIVIVPYIFRMTRAAMIEALESDYVEMARLKGVPTWRIILVHALPNIDRADDPGDRPQLPLPGGRHRRGRVRLQLSRASARAWSTRSPTATSR